MDDANGSVKAPRAAKPAKTANGINNVNGINGAVKLPLNGHPAGQPVRPTRKAKLRGPGLLARTFSIAARLLTWYSILSILFRCPASLDACDDTSPRICKPYFRLKHAVMPHVEPYYDAYAAPYVDLARPYYNAVDQKVIAPGWTYAQHYGAPRMQQVQAFGKAQWEKTVQPQVEKYQDFAQAQYDAKVAPHVNRVSTAFGPYYDIVRTNGLQTYHGLLVPAYQYIQPHLLEGYRATSAFTGKTVVPALVWTWNQTYAFLDGTLGPQIRAMYIDAVEPQLVKIGKRLGRYSTGKKSVPKSLTETLTSVSTPTSSSFTKPAASAPTTTSAPSATARSEPRPSADARSRASMEPIPPPEVDESLEKDDPTRRSAREIVAADLKDWQDRYAKAADEGAAEIDERVQEIAKKMIRRNARITGKSLLEQLEKAAVSELDSLRSAILDVVGATNYGRTTPEEARDQIVKAVRQAGLAVRDKAQAVRTWRENYEAEMQSSVTQAAETHFTILQNIRDLALQKIGMKWAWMDGVTYKDWAKYHLLKSRFDEWKGDLENHVVSHPSLEVAQLEAANIEDEAMKVAASTAKELGRLKQVANWKLACGDDTPEFDSTLMQQAAEAVEAARAAAAGAAEAVSAAKDSVVDRVVEAKDSLKDQVVEAKDSVEDAMGGVKNWAEDAISDAITATSEAASKATDTVLGSEESGPLSETSDPSSEPAVEASLALEDSLTSPADAPVDARTPEPEVELAASEELSHVVEPTSAATPDADDAPHVASSMIFETPVVVGNSTAPVEEEDKAAPVGLPVEEEDDDDSEGLPVSNTATVKPALFGAAAQSVPSRRPILDEDSLDEVSAAMESMRGDLQSAYSAAMSRANDQYSRALSVVSAQIRGTPQPAHEKLLASVTSAYSNAMASASSRLDDAIKVASDQLYGTSTSKTGILPTTVPVPQPPVEWAQIESIASERLQQGRAWAEEQYESAKIAIGLATPTASTPAEQVSRLVDNARHNYYAGVGVAHARYSEFLAAASSAMSSLTASPTPTDAAGSASSIASAAGGSAASAASVVSDSASSVLSAASASASSAASVASENVSAAAVAGFDTAAAAGDKVAEGWDAIVTKISIQVYGAPTPTPWYSSIYLAASEYASSATSAAGEYVSSATSVAGEHASSATSVAGEYASSAGEGAASITSAAGAYASAGSDEIAQQYSAASSIMSELLIGKEPSFSESVISRLGAAYATIQATAASAASQAGQSAKSVGDKVASAASEATEAVKDTASSVRDEL